VQVYIFNHSNFLNKQSNPRLLAYYYYLQEQGHTPCFCFLKANACSNEIYQFKNLGLAFLPGFLNTLSGIIRGCILLIFSKPAMVYIYASHSMYFPIYLVCKAMGIQLIIEKTELDSIKPVMGLKDSINRLLYRWDEKMMSVIRPKTVVITTLLERYYREKNIPKVKLTGLFLPNNSHNKKSEINLSKRFTIGYLGSFADKDDMNTLIRACEIIASNNTKITLVLFGAAKKKFKSVVSNLEILQKGELERENIQTELEKCHVLVAIRKNNPYSIYGFPSKLGEYFGTGRPIICSDNIALPNEFEDRKIIYFVPTENAVLLSDTMLNIWEDYDKAAMIGALGRIAAEKAFDSEIIMNEWYNFVLEEKK
jgi:glycosyltransferase involved in cell wall biosynthesis